MSMSQIFIRTWAFACDIDQNISWWAPYIIRSFLGKLLLHSVPDETPLTLCSWGSHVSGITIHCRKSAIRFQQHLSWEPSDELFYSCCTSCILFGARIRWGDEATAHRRDGAQAQMRLVRPTSKQQRAGAGLHHMRRERDAREEQVRESGGPARLGLGHDGRYPSSTAAGCGRPARVIDRKLNRAGCGGGACRVAGTVSTAAIAVRKR